MVEECAICYEKLSTEQSYTIAECGHTFHTHCIMSWYRCGHSRCPLCLGEGDSVPEEMSRPIMSRYREARFIARKKDTLPFLKRTYAHLCTFEAKYTKHYQETKLWKNQVHDCAPREILKIHRQRRLRKYELQLQMHKLKIEMAECIHTKHVIIPIYKDLNTQNTPQ